VRFCEICGNVSEQERCAICRDPRRDQTFICVVEDAKDVSAIERTREFRGLYHVLGGAISPIAGIGPDDLRITQLMQRLADGTVQEVILATNPNLEGEATATYLSRLLHTLEIRVTRLASGLPVGGDLEYADEVTLGRAFEGAGPSDGAGRLGRAWALYALMAVLWGIPYLFIKEAVDSLTPAAVVAGRTLLGAAVLLPIALRRRALRPALALWPWVLAFGAIEMAGPFLLAGARGADAASGLTGLLVATVPLFATGIALVRGDRSP
jgi:recombination protein RecR